MDAPPAGQAYHTLQESRNIAADRMANGKSLFGSDEEDDAILDDNNVGFLKTTWHYITAPYRKAIEVICGTPPVQETSKSALARTRETLRETFVERPRHMAHQLHDTLAGGFEQVKDRVEDAYESVKDRVLPSGRRHRGEHGWADEARETYEDVKATAHDKARWAADEAKHAGRRVYDEASERLGGRGRGSRWHGRGGDRGNHESLYDKASDLYESAAEGAKRVAGRTADWAEGAWGDASEWAEDTWDSARRGLQRGYGDDRDYYAPRRVHLHPAGWLKHMLWPMPAVRCDGWARIAGLAGYAPLKAHSHPIHVVLL